MPKSNKELAVKLAGEYLNGIYSTGTAKPITEKNIEQILTAFYNAVKELPDD